MSQILPNKKYELEIPSEKYFLRNPYKFCKINFILENFKMNIFHKFFLLGQLPKNNLILLLFSGISS